MRDYSATKIGKLQTEIANMDLLVVLLLALLGNITIRTTPCEQRRNIELFRLNRVCGQIFRPVLYSPRNDPDPEMIPNPEMIPKLTPKSSWP